MERIDLLAKVKSFVNTEEKKRLLANFFSLSILQGANYILPLVTFPYLVRVLGVENFGLLSFATATIAYFQIITDYGFNLTATREISIHRNNKEKLNEIFSSVMTIKVLLMMVSFILLTILVFSFNKFAKDWPVYYLTFGMVIGQVLFPVWFFQGMERMKYITYLNILAKTIFTIAIFFFVKEKKDYYLVPLLNSIGFIIVGFWSLIIVKRTFDIHFKLQSYKTIVYHLKEGWHVFISNIAVSLYTVSTTFILGLFTNNRVVGYYAAGEKIIQAVQGLFNPISQSIYPYISKKIHQSKIEGLRFIRKVTLLFGMGMFTISLFLFIFSEPLVTVLLGLEYFHSIIVVKILSFLPFIIFLSNIFGIQTMLNFDRKKTFSRILIAGSIINLILSILLVPIYQHIGSAISVLLVETFITSTMLLCLQKSGINFIKGELKNV
ncbi:flippase [Thermicanus aegyptius]|uniref:flippase n=1 Tax=Thermicanus aegyptius TaxID=94009 RepID=UPI0005870122|nr:flippase [Thermicanus aegyptius]